MKRIMFILLVLLGIILIAGCGKDKKPTAPDLTNEDFFFTGDYILVMLSSPFGHGDYEQYFFISAKYPVYSIKANGKEIELYGEGVPYNGYYLTFSDDYYSEDDFFVLPGEVCKYSFVMNGKSYSGSITAANEPTVSYPSFRFNANYNLSWSISKNPSNFVVDYLFSDDWDNDDNDYEDYVQLKGNARSYSISKSGWQHMNEHRLFYWVDLAAVNYMKKSNNQALSFYFVSSDDDEDWDWKAAPNPRPNLSNRQRGNKLFKQILSGKLVLD